MFAMIFKILDEWLSVSHFYLALLKQRDNCAIAAGFILSIVLILHFIQGGGIFFILDGCILISLYQSFRNLYIDANYPK